MHRLAFAAVFVTAVASAARAEEKPMIVSGDLPVIAAPTLSEPLDKSWSMAKGVWTPTGGVLKGVEKPEEKHAAVLHHNVGLQTAVIECDFKLDAGAALLIGCDGKGHVGRVVVKAGGVDIAEDSTKPSHVIASLKQTIAPGTWHHLRVEWTGDQMAARMDDKDVKAQHAFLASPKARSWLAVGSKSASVEVKNLKISGVK
jgi:hypothetical protein